MSLKRRVQKLQETLGKEEKPACLFCVHPDDWEGEMGPGCRRESEAKREAREASYSLLQCFGFCTYTREKFPDEFMKRRREAPIPGADESYEVKHYEINGGDGR